MRENNSRPPSGPPPRESAGPSQAEYMKRHQEGHQNSAVCQHLTSLAKAEGHAEHLQVPSNVGGGALPVFGNTTAFSPSGASNPPMTT